MKRIMKRLRTPIESLKKVKKKHRHSLVGVPNLWKMKRDFQIQFLKDMNLKPQHYLFDIGCGTLRGGIPLIDYLHDGHYFGVDVRTKALKEGRKELKEAGLEEKNPTLLLTPDISQLAIEQEFDYIWAFSVLFHMNDKILNNTLAFVNKHLSERGAFYANVNIGKRKEEGWQGFPVITRSFAFYEHACARNGLATSNLRPLKDHGHFSNIESDDSQRMLKITKNR